MDVLEPVDVVRLLPMLDEAIGAIMLAVPLEDTPEDATAVLLVKAALPLDSEVLDTMD